MITILLLLVVVVVIVIVIVIVFTPVNSFEGRFEKKDQPSINQF
jgi:predicted Holliday junction resolvase-like endonuclease